MKNLIYAFLFCFVFLSTNASASEWSILKPWGAILASKNLEANYNEQERIQANLFPMLESAIGCKLTNDIREMPLEQSWFFTGTYKCQGASNKYNSNVNVILNGPIHWFFQVIMAFLGGWVTRRIILMFVDAARGEGESASSIATYVVMVIVAILLLIPLYKSSDEINAKKDTNLITMGYYTIYAIGYTYGSYYLHKAVANDVTEQPYVEIPEAKNVKTKEVINLIDFVMCNQRTEGNTKQILQFTRTDGHISAFSQIGKCVLEIDHEIDEGTIAVAKLNGLPDLYQMETETLNEAYTKMFQEVHDLTVKVNAYKPITTGSSPIFQRNQSCDNLKTVDPTFLDTTGLKMYVYDSANCIASEFVTRLTRAPGVTEAQLSSAPSRAVQLCKTDYSSDIETAQRACAQTMCASDSSPYLCSAQINNYLNLVGSRFMTDPNYITIPNYIVRKYYGSTGVAELGKSFLNSMSISSYISEDILEPIETGEAAFTVSFDKIDSVNKSVFSTDELMDTYSSEKSMSTNPLDVFVKYFTNKDGFLSLGRFKDCLEHPDSVSPSGRRCPSIFKTYDIQGNTFLAISSEIRLGTKAVGMFRQTKAEKQLAQAGVDAAQTGLKATAGMFGAASDVAINFMLSSAMNNAANDAFSEYGADIGPEASYVIAAVYANPDAESFANQTANTLWVAGIAMKFGFVISFGMIIISFILDAFTKITKEQLTILPHFVKLLGKHGINPTNDTWKPIQVFIVNFLSWGAFGGIILFAASMVTTLFSYKAISYAMFDRVLIESANSSLLAAGIDQLMKTALFIFFVSFIMAYVFKFSVFVIGSIINTYAFGMADKNEKGKFEIMSVGAKNETQ
ncbi:hypothetical protein [Pseudomonas coronafaciens]|uniref:hypothetical protein n=1 Tax=Pseudomonas coronafaciens TaxID=53409 RepID=UPI000F008080|nr:hypothetical protein [Pseudomonas coronafaciens]